MNARRATIGLFTAIAAVWSLGNWGAADLAAAQFLIANTGGGNIQNSFGGTSTTFITPPVGYAPADIKPVAGGNYMVLTNQGLLEYTHAGVQVGATPFSHGDGASPLNNPQEIAIQPGNGDILVTSYGSNVINRYNGTTGAYIDSPVTSATGADGPTGMVFHNGDLYVSNLNNGLITEYQPQPDGNPYTLLGTFATAGNDPHHIAFGPDGNLYVTEFGANLVEKFNGTTGADLGAFVTAGSGGLSNPTGLAFGPDGSLYVSSYSSGKVLEYNSNGLFNSVFLSGLVNPIALLSVPEPSTLTLTLIGGIGLILAVRRRRS